MVAERALPTSSTHVSTFELSSAPRPGLSPPDRMPASRTASSPSAQRISRREFLLHENQSAFHRLLARRARVERTKREEGEGKVLKRPNPVEEKKSSDHTRSSTISTTKRDLLLRSRFPVFFLEVISFTLSAHLMRGINSPTVLPLDGRSFTPLTYSAPPSCHAVSSLYFSASYSSCAQTLSAPPSCLYLLFAWRALRLARRFSSILF